jgi:hypothetical protein
MAGGWFAGNRGERLMAETMLFHIIVDEFHRAFTIDRPDGTNGMRLRVDMLRTSRA